MNILRVCADEFLVTDGKEVFRIMSRSKIPYPETQLEVEGANLYSIYRDVCSGCPDRPAIFRAVCDKCPKKVERR